VDVEIDGCMRRGEVSEKEPNMEMNMRGCHFNNNTRRAEYEQEQEQQEEYENRR
jgi:hypothetical protein